MAIPRGQSAQAARASLLHRASSLFSLEPFNSRKENHGLPVQARQPRSRTEAFSSLEIENDDFISSHTIEPAVRPKAQTPRLLKPRTVFWYKHTRETPVNVIILADRRDRIWCTEWMLAAYDNVAAWRDRKVK